MFCLMREVHKRRMTDNKVLRRRGGGVLVLGQVLEITSFNSQICFTPGKLIIKNCLKFLSRNCQYCAPDDFKFALYAWSVCKHYLSFWQLYHLTSGVARPCCTRSSLWYFLKQQGLALVLSSAPRQGTSCVPTSNHWYNFSMIQFFQWRQWSGVSGSY
jgi:hypothetical protein